MRIEPELGGVDIIVLGDFNPAVFTPAWFALHDLLPKNVADNANLKVAHPRVAAFDADWFSLQVTGDRFVAVTSQAPWVRVRDLVARVFKEQLVHTPLRACGINREVHFRLRNAEERDRIGRTLAPVAPWGACGRDLRLDSEGGGMTSLTMSQLRPEGRAAGGQINVTVEPSVQIPDGMGIYVHVNDHYAVDDAVSGTADKVDDVAGGEFWRGNETRRRDHRSRHVAGDEQGELIHDRLVGVQRRTAGRHDRMASTLGSGACGGRSGSACGRNRPLGPCTQSRLFSGRNRARGEHRNGRCPAGVHRMTRSSKGQPTVDRTIRESGINLRRIAASRSCIRLRRPLEGQGRWTVEKLGAAYRLTD